MAQSIELPDQYGAVLEEIKQRVRSARLTAQRSVNTELIGSRTAANLFLQVGVRRGKGPEELRKVSVPFGRMIL